MKKSKNSIVAFPAFSAQTEAQPTESRVTDQAHAESGRTVEPEDRQDAVSGGELDALTELAGKDIHPADVVEFCRKNGMDERKVFGGLGRIESVRLHRLFHDCAIRSISATDILVDGPFPGVEGDRIERVFTTIWSRVEPYEKGYISYNDATSWPTINPSVMSAYLEIMRRLVRAMRRAIVEVYRLDERIIDDPSSDFVSPTADDLANAIINDPDEFFNGECVFLEIHPGQYEGVPCKLVNDMAETLEAEAAKTVPFVIRGVEGLRDPGQPQVDGLHNNKPFHSPEAITVRPGFAKALEKLYPGLDDETWSDILNARKTPDGRCARYDYKGKKADAARLCAHVGMPIRTWNAWFMTNDGKPIESKNLGKYRDGLQAGNRLLMDELKDRGIYLVLNEYLSVNT